MNNNSNDYFGKVMITAKIIEPTDKITFNVASLKISGVAYAKHKVDANWSDSNHSYVAITSGIVNDRSFEMSSHQRSNSSNR